MFCFPSFPLVLSPPSDKLEEILSTSTESGSVIVDVIRQTKPPEGKGGVVDAGWFVLISNGSEVQLNT